MRKAHEAVSRAAGIAIAIGIATSAMGCTTYRDQLLRCQQSFEHNQHEHALGLMRALEPDMYRLQMPEQAQYAYLRGMTDYRIGYRPDARHWLSIAKAYEDASPGTLPSDWKARMTEALDEMNNVVYAEGVQALTNVRKPGEDGASTNGKDTPASGNTATPVASPAKAK